MRLHHIPLPSSSLLLLKQSGETPLSIWLSLPQYPSPCVSFVLTLTFSRAESQRSMKGCRGRIWRIGTHFIQYWPRAYLIKSRFWAWTYIVNNVEYPISFIINDLMDWGHMSYNRQSKVENECKQTECQIAYLIRMLNTINSFRKMKYQKLRYFDTYSLILR